MAPRRGATALALIAGSLAACVTAGSGVAVNSAATGSSAFSLGAPGAYKTKSGLVLVGRICRRGRSTSLTPARVRVDHVAATGEVTASAHAAVRAIGRRADERCSSYGVNVDWTVAESESLRACFDRGRACPGGGPATSVPVVPVPDAPAPP
jgi:hypothetical protein